MIGEQVGRARLAFVLLPRELRSLGMQLVLGSAEARSRGCRVAECQVLESRCVSGHLVFILESRCTIGHLVFMYFFKTESHVTQAGLELLMENLLCG